jgi:hypothetical protein
LNKCCAGIVNIDRMIVGSAGYHFAKNILGKRNHAISSCFRNQQIDSPLLDSPRL